MKRYEEYRDSYIAGITQIPASWSLEKLKFVASCNDDVLPDSTEDGEIINYVEIGDVNYVNGITNATEYEFGEAPSRARRITRPDDIIVSTVRTYLKAIAKVSTTNLIVSTGFAVIRPRHIDKNFMCYALLAPPFIEEVMSRSVGVSYPAIKASLLMDIKICVPPILEQQFIACFLDAKTKPIDNIISKREKQIELLEEMKSAIISCAVTKGLNSNAKMKDCGIEWIGEIPEGWEAADLKRYAKISTGKTPSTKYDEYFENEEIVWFTPGDFPDNGIFLMDSSRKIDKRAIEANEAFLYPERSVYLVGIGGTLGKIGIFKDKASCNQQINIIICKANVCKKFVAYYLYSKREILKVYSNAATLPILNQEKTGYIKIVMPPMEEQQAVVSYLDSETSKLDARIVKRRKQIELLHEYKQALITNAVTGKIDVRGFNS